MISKSYFTDNTYLASGWAKQVRIDVVDGLITSVASNAKPKGCIILDGPTLPTIANLHSHSFQYLMAGMAEISLNPNDSFWSWRDLMYKLVAELSPDDIRIISTQLYIDMLKAGYTQVGEFQYLFNTTDGKKYDCITEISDQLTAAADSSGIGLALLPTLYSHSGFGGQSPNEGQKRFVNTTEQYLKHHQAYQKQLQQHPLNQLGICFHSLRAVTEQQINEVLSAVNDKQVIHIHISEQEKEVNDCIAWSGQRPVEWLNNTIGLNARWSLIHATHINDNEIKSIANSGAVIGLCPSTEANLGDGIFSATQYLKHNGNWGIGSDSHISVSIKDELRTLEYSQRFRDQQRNRLHDKSNTKVGDYLFTQAHCGGNQALSVNNGLEVGQRADFMVLDTSNPFIGSRKSEDIINSWIFASNENVIKDVYVAGKLVIEDFCHPLQAESNNHFSDLMKRIFS